MIINLILIVKIFLFQIFITLIIVKLSNHLKLLDIPSSRKIHKKPVPYTGGLILTFTYLFIIVLTSFESQNLNNILSFSVLICLAGFLDDKYNLNPGTKITLQILPVFFLVNNGFFLNDLGNYIFLNKLELGSFSQVFTILCCLFLINAFNYSDGRDGLLTTISSTILISYYFYTKSFSFYPAENLIFFILFPLLIFFFFNIGIFKNYKIFLGDSGSNLIGFIFGFLAIFIFKEINLHPALIIWPLAYIVYEFLSVNVIRIFFKKNIFKPGFDHFHYEIGELYKINNFKVIIIITFINILFSTIGFIFYSYLVPDIILLLYFLIFILYLLFRIKIQKKLKK